MKSALKEVCTLKQKTEQKAKQTIIRSSLFAFVSNYLFKLQQYGKHFTCTPENLRKTTITTDSYKTKHLNLL